MFVRYLGHSCFLIKSTKGSTVLMDPYADYIRYNFPTIDADIVVMSHEHRDHNAVYRVGGQPMVVKRISSFPMECELNVQRTEEKFTFYGVPTNHDNFGGRRRGPNTVWHFYLEGVHYVHLGDLGALLTEEQITAIGRADVLFVPVGGKSTLGPAEAGLVINQLRPNLIFPMHYKTPEIEALGYCDNTLEDFTSRMADVDDQAAMSYDVDQAKLPDLQRVILLRF